MAQNTREELSFMLDEELEELRLHRRISISSESDFDEEITDADVEKIIIVTQVRNGRCLKFGM